MYLRATSSGKLTASQVITTLGGHLLGIDVIAPSEGTAIVRIYNSATATSDVTKILAEVQMDAGYLNFSHSYDHPVIGSQGIYAELDQSEAPSADASFIIRFSAGC